MPSVHVHCSFQFIAVFNQRFTELPRRWQTVHYSSLLLATLTVCCMLSVAAFHRIAEPHKFTLEFVRRGGWTVSIGLLFLATAMCLDIGVVTQLIYGSTAGAIAAAASCWSIFILAWFAYPIGHRIHYYGLTNLHHNYGGNAHAGTGCGSASGTGSVNGSGSGSGGLGATQHGSGGALSDTAPGMERHGSPGQADDDADDYADGREAGNSGGTGSPAPAPATAPMASRSLTGQQQVRTQRVPQTRPSVAAAPAAPVTVVNSGHLLSAPAAGSVHLPGPIFTAGSVPAAREQSQASRPTGTGSYGSPSLGLPLDSESKSVPQAPPAQMAWSTAPAPASAMPPAPHPAAAL